LFSSTELKIRLAKLGVTKLEANSSSISLEFSAEPKIDTAKLINLIQTNPSKYRLVKGTALKVSSPNETVEQRKQQIDSLIETLVG